MKILIFGMGNIGKSTVGELLAQKIGYDFIDMDTKIKEKYGTMLGFQDEYNDQYERDELRAEMISSWIQENENVVIALSPIAYLDAYEDFFEDTDIICFDLTDRTENIFKRLVFTDDNDNLLHIPQSYLNKHKAYYMQTNRWQPPYIPLLLSKPVPPDTFSGKHHSCFLPPHEDCGHGNNIPTPANTSSPRPPPHPPM
jgi:shikimate kinase